MQSKYIWMDGNLVPFEQATVHFLSPSLHYGVSVYEGLRCYKTPQGPAVFRLNDHMRRFIQSAHILGIQNFPHTLEELCSAVFQTIRANQIAECYIRPLMYLDGPMGLKLDQARPVVGIAVWAWENYHGREALEKGLRMTVSSYTRLHPNINMTKSKVAGNYVNSMLAKTDALRMGFDETIMLDPEGFVAEASGMNLFMVRGGVVYTPARATILEGITRDSVVTLINDLGYQLIEEPITRDQLYIADEIFLCGTAAEVVGVCEIDFRQIGSGVTGEITRQVQKAYYKTVRGERVHSGNWLDYVPTG
jgi:branched-chain amino acid aminotransferase